MTTTSAPVGVHTLVGIGVALENAIPCALAERGLSISAVADTHGLDRSNLSRLVNGGARTILSDYRDALAEELGVRRAWLDAELEARWP